MSTSQIREVVLKVVKRSVEPRGTVTPAAQGSGKTGDGDRRKPAHTRDAGVERVVLAVGEEAGIVGDQGEVNLVVAKSEFVDDAGVRDINPVAGNRVRAYWVGVFEGCIDDGVIRAIAQVVADQ